MAKILPAGAAILLTILFGLFILVWAIVPPLPPHTNEIIEEVVEGTVPELVSGQKAFGWKEWAMIFRLNIPEQCSRQFLALSNHKQFIALMRFYSTYHITSFLQNMLQLDERAPVVHFFR